MFNSTYFETLVKNVSLQNKNFNMKSFFLLVCILIGSHLSYSQSNFRGWAINEAFENRADRDRFVNISTKNDPNIKGSKYLSKDFVSARLSTMPEKIYGVRYNIFNDEMEFEGLDNKVYALSKIDDSTMVTFTKTGDSYHLFRYISDKNQQKKGYFLKLNPEGNYLLLKKKRVVFFDVQTPDNGYDNPKPAMYKKTKDRIYIKNRDNDAVLFSTKKSKLKELFPDNGKQVIRFIKKNNIKLKKESDLIAFVNFLNTL